MLAGRAFAGGLRTFVDIAAVCALPFHNLFLSEYFARGHIGRQFAVPLFVKLLYLGDFLE
jgi:hypothetical protein